MFYQKITDIFSLCSVDYDKNYLDEKELRKPNNLVNIFLDVAESNVGLTKN